MALDPKPVNGGQPGHPPEPRDTSRERRAWLVLLAILTTVLGAGSHPSRIISIVPAVTEMLFAIGAGERVIGVSSFDRHPASVGRLTRVGGLLDPDVERILSLHPDLVIVYATQSDLREQLAQARIPIFPYAHGSLADVTETIRQLGQRTGHASQADRVAIDVDRQLAAIRERVQGRHRPRTLLVFGRERLALRNIYASGGIGFLHDMLDAAGGTNVLGDIKREAVQATTEMILARAPEVIIEMREGPSLAAGQIARERQTWDALQAVPAVRRRRIEILSGDGLVVPGPRVGAATERFARALHPEAFGRQH